MKDWKDILWDKIKDDELYNNLNNIEFKTKLTMLTKDTWFTVLEQMRDFAKQDKELTHITLEIKIRTNVSKEKKNCIYKLNLTKDED
jgi:hypothetical protein